MPDSDEHIPNRYRIASGVEGDFEPGSRARVLANKLGICRKKQMDIAEFEAFLLAQEKYLSIVGTATVFTARLVCRMHHDWLGGIYQWAGQYRQVELSKGVFSWPPASLVKRNMIAVERETLARLTPCRSGPLEVIAASLARVQADLLLGHPFRDGNGRVSRWVTDLMAMQTGLPALDYAFRGRGSEKRRQAYVSAVSAGYMNNYEPLAHLLAEAAARALERERDGRDRWTTPP